MDVQLVLKSCRRLSYGSRRVTVLWGMSSQLVKYPNTAYPSHMAGTPLTSLARAPVTRHVSSPR